MKSARGYLADNITLLGSKEANPIAWNLSQALLEMAKSIEDLRAELRSLRADVQRLPSQLQR
jgi:hypothetical protein